MMLGNADIVMLTLIDRLALWCIGNPFESFRSNIIIPVDTFIVTVINDLQFKFHFFIVIMQASNKFHGIEISLLYNIIPFYRNFSTTTFGYFFFLNINNICWCNLQFHALTLHFVWVSRLSIKSVVRGTQRRLVVPLHPPPPRPDIDPATYISVQHQAWTTRMICQAGVWSPWILAQDAVLSC